MRTTQITAVAFGSDPKVALERLLVDLLAAIESDDRVPITVQARVAQHAVVHAPDPMPLDRLAPTTPPDEERFVAEGKVWCLRPKDTPSHALRAAKVYMPVLPPAPPADRGHDGGNDE